MNKKTITEKLDEFSPYDFDLSIDDLIKKFQRCKTEFKNYKNLHLSEEIKYEYNEEYQKFILYGNRLETDKELEKRIKEIENTKAKKKEEQKLRKEEEYKNYLKLKDKYENKKRVRVKQ